MIFIITDEDRRLRSKIISQGRRKINKQLKEGIYLELLREESGIMNEKEFILDKEFLSDMVNEIERNRKLDLVYDEDFRRHWLDEWLKKKRRKEVLMKVSGSRLGSYERE